MEFSWTQTAIMVQFDKKFIYRHNTIKFYIDIQKMMGFFLCQIIMIYKKFNKKYIKCSRFFWDDPRIHKTSQMTLKFELYFIFGN